VPSSIMMHDESRPWPMSKYHVTMTTYGPESGSPVAHIFRSPTIAVSIGKCTFPTSTRSTFAEKVTLQASDNICVLDVETFGEVQSPRYRIADGCFIA
jgi:hypothetical protein